MGFEVVRADVAEQLAAEFDGRISLPIVLDEIATAERELHGQVPAGAMSELVHRLAAVRLTERQRAVGLLTGPIPVPGAEAVDLI